MQRYLHSTRLMDLGALAADSVIWALSNPAAVAASQFPNGRILIVKKLLVEKAFVGVAALVRVPFGLARAAAGVSAGGTATSAAATTSRRNPSAADPVGIVRYGPAAVTGVPADAFGDFMTTLESEQLTAPTIRHFVIADVAGANLDDGIVLLPGTSLIITSRALSIAGVGISIDVEWGEKIL